jgi:hypothetical protein
MARVRVRVSTGVLLLAGFVAAPALAHAQQPQSAPPAAPAAAPAQVTQVREELERLRLEFEALRRTYDERLQQLERRLIQISGGPMVLTPPATQTSPPEQQQTPPPAPQQTEPTTVQPGLTQQQAGSGKVFNPDMSVNGNFVAAAGKNPFTTLGPFQLTEVEAAFQAIVDPYARADFFLAASPEGLEVEEGYITFTALPANLLLKVGKMRANFGKMNTLHTHSLPSVDRPLVTENLMGGEEGLSDAGMSLSHLLRNPYLYLELTGEVFAGTSDVFQSQQRSKLVYVGRARGYHDINDASNFEIGTSFAFGPTTLDVPQLLTPIDAAPTVEVPGLNKHVIGLDATYRYRPPSRAIYRRFNLRTELMWSHQDMIDAPVAKAFGAYVSGEYQFARRWYIGGRLDRSARVLDGSAIDKGGSAFLTFWPTEFSQMRGQYRYISFAEGSKANEFLLQFNFSIGAHGAHIF